jgi:hypothetical protein
MSDQQHSQNAVHGQGRPTQLHLMDVLDQQHVQQVMDLARLLQAAHEVAAAGDAVSLTARTQRSLKQGLSTFQDLLRAVDALAETLAVAQKAYELALLEKGVTP